MANTMKDTMQDTIADVMKDTTGDTSAEIRPKTRRAFPAGTAWLILAAVFLLFSCQTLQEDLTATSLSEAGGVDIAQVEALVVPLDAGFTRGDLAAARSGITGIEARGIQDAVFRAQLAGWSGRLYLLEGRRNEAEKQLKLSRDLNPGNIPALVLSARLENDPEKRLVLIREAMKVEPSSGELAIEYALTLFALNRYREAAGAFDTGLAGLAAEVYEQTYRTVRNRAWELRDVSSSTESRAAEILQQSTITWGEAIELVKAETDLLRFLTAGRDWSREELFTRLLSRNFIPMTQDVYLTVWPSREPAAGDTLRRSGAAWFIWQLNAENKSDKGLLTRYSDRYKRAGGSARSPIPDLPVNSPFLDAVLGCVEGEIMALPDGRNFMPWDPVKPSAFLNMLRKIL